MYRGRVYVDPSVIQSSKHFMVAKMFRSEFGRIDTELITKDFLSLRSLGTRSSSS